MSLPGAQETGFSIRAGRRGGRTDDGGGADLGNFAQVPIVANQDA
jgi:hypothetical protein